MPKRRIVSRIHKYIPTGLMNELDKICNNRLFTDNNKKVRKIKEALDKYEIMYNELGPGTNRFAISIDGYVFKIAMDDHGKLDNANEFTMSKELQPFVIKVYENNDLISVSEYVTLISREEFLNSRMDILEILSILAESYLLGDVGFIEKNFTNWGYRDDGQLVILDFAYIHNIEGHEMLCRKCGTMLEYNDNFHYLRCPNCSQKYNFSQIRRILYGTEWKYINDVKNASYHLTSDMIYITEDGEQMSKPKLLEEESSMTEDKNVFNLDEEEIEVAYEDAFNFLTSRLKGGKVDDPKEIDVEESVEEHLASFEDLCEDEEEDELEDPIPSAADLLRQQAEELLDTADAVEAKETALEQAECKVEQTNQALVEVTTELVETTEELEENKDKVLNLEEALANVDMSDESESISRDEKAAVVVNVVTPIVSVEVEDTEVKVNSDKIVEVSEVVKTDDEVVFSSENYAQQMQKAYLQGQKKQETTPDDGVSVVIRRPGGNKPKTDEQAATTDETNKYELMAKDMGYDID